MIQFQTCYLLIFGVIYYTASNADAIEVEIKQGKLAGTVLESRNGTKFYAFLAIPYAKPPVGKLRFEPPQEPGTWDEVRNATVPPPMCIQKTLALSTSISEITGQEDCLYLNVYTQNVLIKDALLPVIVYIHGGSFETGAGSIYQPDYIMDHPVVMVTFNYRLGPLGFLSAADEILPGNYGMKDQAAALKWVQKNIAAFGGDPNKVTLWGQSAGGASVHLHLHSPLSKGLFRGAIAQSGSALAQWVVTPREYIRQLFRSFGILSGCPIMSTKALRDCLREIPADELVKIHHKFKIMDADILPPFTIAVESERVKNAFLTESPWNQEAVNRVPLIIGITSGEGGFMATKFLSDDDKLMVKLNNDYKRLFPAMHGYGYHLPPNKISEVTESLRKYYFREDEIGDKSARQLVDMFTDSIFSFSAMETALQHPAKSYFYYYDHRSVISVNDIIGNYKGDLGVGHGDDVTSLFHVPYFFPKVTSGLDFAVSSRMVNYFVSFAKTGDPNHQEELWQPVKSDEFEYLHITTEADKMGKNLLKDRYNFWKSLGIKHSQGAEGVNLLKEEL